MKILNLYANIGGNRKLWGNEHEITAVEIDPKIAEFYRNLWPQDKVVVGDAHDFLLSNYGDFDFIWSSPPCPTHSKLNLMNHISPYKDNTKQIENGGAIPPRYPDMALYQEIIFLKHFYKGRWCVENVVGYYEPLIPPTLFGSHYFWTNFYFPNMGVERLTRGIGGSKRISIAERAAHRGYDIEELKKHKPAGVDIDLALKDITEPELAKHILDWAQKEEHTSLFSPPPNLK